MNVIAVAVAVTDLLLLALEVQDDDLLHHMPVSHVALRTIASVTLFVAFAYFG